MDTGEIIYFKVNRRYQYENLHSVQDFYSNTNTQRNFTPKAKGVVAINMEELGII